MEYKKIIGMDQAVDRFLIKASRRNDPLESYRNQKEYKRFQDGTETIIADQIKFVSKHLNDIQIWKNTDLQEHQIKALIATYLDRYMPKYADSMTYKIVYSNLKAAFEWSCKAAYERMGVKILNKAVDYSTDFTLTNQAYLDAIQNESNYLLNTKSKSYDQTTKDRLVNIVMEGRLNQDTIDEISSDLLAQVDGISSVRSFMIANTETANAFGDANQAFLEQNDIPQKEWVTAGDNPCEICQANEDQGPIDTTDSFDSGDDSEPAHPNCECYTQGVGLDLSAMDPEELDSLILWDGN